MANFGSKSKPIHFLSQKSYEQTFESCQMRFEVVIKRIFVDFENKLFKCLSVAVLVKMWIF